MIEAKALAEAKKLAEIAEKRAELSKKKEAAERKLKMQQDMLKSRINLDKSIGTKNIDVEYAAKEVKRISNELDRLK